MGFNDEPLVSGALKKKNFPMVQTGPKHSYLVQIAQGWFLEGLASSLVCLGLQAEVVVVVVADLGWRVLQMVPRCWFGGSNYLVLLALLDYLDYLGYLALLGYPALLGSLGSLGSPGYLGYLVLLVLPDFLALLGLNLSLNYLVGVARRLDMADLDHLCRLCLLCPPYHLCPPCHLFGPVVLVVLVVPVDLVGWITEYVSKLTNNQKVKKMF